VTAVTIAPDVAARLGAELADRVRQDPGIIASVCRDCDQPLGAEPVAVIVVEAADQLASAAVSLAHTRCSDSQVRTQATGDADLAEAVTVITGNFPTADGPRPTLWVSYDLAALLTEAGEVQDLAVAHLLAVGWHLVTRLGPTPPPLPDGWTARYTMLDPSDVSSTPGRFELLDPAGRPYGEVEHLQQGQTWVPAVAQAGGRCVIYAGALNLGHPDRAANVIPVGRQAARDGRLVGGTVRVDVRLPDGRPILP
jgi:hypothetical protein